MQNPRKKKTKKILVKKKKNPSQPTETVQNIPSSDYESRIPSECDDFNFDFESLKTVISQSMQDAVQSLPKDKLENMSFQDVSKLMTEKVTEAMPKNNKQGFDMSSMMATLMSNAEKMVMGNLNTTDEKTEEPKDPSGPPSLYDKAPDAPTERSGKYASIEEEKQRHLIYKGFNTVLISILNMLMEKLPHKRSHYMTLKRLIETVITTNPLKPRELWKNSIDKNPEYQDKLSKYSKENVAFICKHLHNIDPLHTLELNDEWHHFTSDDYKKFWDKMSQLQNISEMIDVIHPDMMTAIQEMTLRVNKSDAVKIDSKGNVKNIGELFQILSGEVFKDSKIVNGMQKMSSEIMQAVKDNSIPQPPSFVNILNKVDKI